MFVRSVRIALVAFIVLLLAARTDLAFAANITTSQNVTPHSLTSANWGAIAGSNSSALASGNAYGPITPYISSCTGIPTYYITLDSNGWGSGGFTTTFQTAGWDNAIAVGMTVSGTGIVNSGLNTITNVNIATRELTLATGGNTSSPYTTLTIGVTTSSCCVTTDFYLTTDGSGWISNDKRVGLQQSTSQLAIGMTVTGMGIANSGTNTISSFSTGNRINLTFGPNTSPNYTTLKFSTPCGSSNTSQYFDVINIGTVDLLSLSIQQTVTTTGGNSIQLQSCSATWDEVANTCSGTIATLMTTIGSGVGANSPQTFNWIQTITVGASIRLRAVSTEPGKTTTISVWVSNSDVRATTNTNA